MGPTMTDTVIKALRFLKEYIRLMLIGAFFGLKEGDE